MPNLQPRQRAILLGLLALLMGLTRASHFGSLERLPDASLAVFLLAGFYLPSARVLVLLLLEACLVDLAVTQGDPAAWCLSPAYWFLSPTYGLLWAAGRVARGLLSLLVTAVVGLITRSRCPSLSRRQPADHPA